MLAAIRYITLHDNNKGTITEITFTKVNDLIDIAAIYAATALGQS